MDNILVKALALRRMIIINISIRTILVAFLLFLSIKYNVNRYINIAMVVMSTLLGHSIYSLYEINRVIDECRIYDTIMTKGDSGK